MGNASPSLQSLSQRALRRYLWCCSDVAGLNQALATVRDTLAGCDGTIIFDPSTKGLSYQLSATYSLPAATKRRSLFLSLPLSVRIAACVLIFSFVCVGVLFCGHSGVGCECDRCGWGDPRSLCQQQTHSPPTGHHHTRGRRHQVRGRKGEYIENILSVGRSGPESGEGEWWVVAIWGSVHIQIV